MKTTSCLALALGLLTVRPTSVGAQKLPNATEASNVPTQPV